MGRRIRWLGVIMVVCLGLVVVQLVNIQLVKGKQLQTSPDNPRVAALSSHNPRGLITAADGTVLAKSIPRPAGTHKTIYPFDYMRQYPQGPLFAGITGYDSPLYYGTAGIEEQYNAELGAHQQAPQTLSQLLFREKMPTTTDDVSLTVEPALQQAAWNALTTLPPGPNKDGAVVVLDPKTGAVLAMVSNPTYDPNALVSTDVHAENLAHYAYVQKDPEGYYPLRPTATEEFYFPGSTMKVVTSTAAYNLKPALAAFDYPVQPCQSFPDSNRLLCNDGSNPSNSSPCGGTMTAMLPESCDPGYGELGVQIGVATLRQQAQLFGINAVPPIDLPNVIASQLLPLPATSQVDQAYTSIGQEFIKDTALQNAMVAAGIANGGNLMTPHLMSSIHDSQGRLVQSYAPEVDGHGLLVPDGTAGHLADGRRRRLRYGVGRGLPRLPVRSGEDGDRPDRRDPRVERRLDDRLCARQQPEDCRRGRRAGPEHLLGRSGGGRADREGSHDGGAPARLGQPALRRQPRADVGVHVGPLITAGAHEPPAALYTTCVSTQIVEAPARDEFRSAVGMLKLLADETRLRVIWALLEGEHSVNELAELVGAQPAAVSQHLAKLRLARLVRSRREGTRIFYVVDDAHVRRLVEEVLTHADHVTAHG